MAKPRAGMGMGVAVDGAVARPIRQPGMGMGMGVGMRTVGRWVLGRARERARLAPICGKNMNGRFRTSYIQPLTLSSNGF
jgi:hypothetical protein